MPEQTKFQPVYDEVEKYEQFPTSDERTLACLIYVLGFFTSFIVPLIIWLIKGNESQFINRTGKNYLNAYISYAIWSFVSALLMIVLIGFITTPILLLMHFIFSIIGAVKAYNGEDYLMPLSIPFMK